MDFRNLIDRILCEAPMERQEMGLGFEVWHGEHIALAGGMRSGGSPAGLLRCAYTMYDTDAMKAGTPQDKADVGIVEVYKDGNNDIRGLINIKLNKNNRKAGIGTHVVQALVETCPTDFSVWDIRKVAVGFWKKMGCEFYTDFGKPIPDPKKYTGFIAGVIRKPGSMEDVTNLPGFRKRTSMTVTRPE